MTELFKMYLMDFSHEGAKPNDPKDREQFKGRRRGKAIAGFPSFGCPHLWAVWDKWRVYSRLSICGEGPAGTTSMVAAVSWRKSEKCHSGSVGDRAPRSQCAKQPRV